MARRTRAQPPGNRDAPRISVTLRPEDHAALQMLAEVEHQSMDWLASQAVRRFLEVKAAERPELLPGRQMRLDLAAGVQG